MSAEKMEPAAPFVNGHAAPLGVDPFVHLLERRAPGNAVLAEAPSGVVTAAAANAESERIADELARAGLPAGAVVAFVAANGAGYVAGFVALRRRGLVVLLLDAGMPRAEQERVVVRLGAAALLRVAESRTGSPAGSGWRLRVELERLVPRAERLLPDVCALKLTSGSTGEPRGIAVSADALLADGRALWKSMGLRASDRCLALVPMSHSYGFSVLTLPALLGGATLILPEGDDPLHVAQCLRASVLPSTPAWYRAMSRLAAPPPWSPTLRLALSAGAPLTPETARDFRGRFGPYVHAFYGASEAGGITFDRRGDAAERGSVGTPVAGVRVELVGAESGEGVVRAHSAAVATRYVPAAPGDDERLRSSAYTTDDVACFEDGELLLRGRRGDWINVHGKKVHPREVESVLAQMEGVDEAAVVAHAVPGRGQIVRAVIACEGGALTYRDVLAWCRARLASHKLPRSLVFVPALPRNARGKLDRAALLALQPQAPDAASNAPASR